MNRSALKDPIAAEISVVGAMPAPESSSARCIVCGSSQRTVICTADEVRRQFAHALDFHRRRLRRRRPRGDDEVLADRGNYTHDYVTDLVACTTCRLLFRAARPAPQTAVAEYASEHYGAERLQALFESQLELFRARIGLLQGMLADVPQPVVIEIGSFVGGFISAAQELGWTAVGLDPGEEVVAFCRSRGLAVHRTVADEAPIAAGTADCVAIWNTLDQLPDPSRTLAAARRWLRPDGLLVVRVPNGACFRLAMRLLPRLPWRGPLLAALAWNNLLGFPYLYGYSVATLDQLLSRFDFTRVVVRPDTLVRLADEKTALWAAWEERILKTLWRLPYRFDPRLAPWFDAYYVRREVEKNSAVEAFTTSC